LVVGGVDGGEARDFREGIERCEAVACDVQDSQGVRFQALERLERVVGEVEGVEVRVTGEGCHLFDAVVGKLEDLIKREAQRR